MEKSGEISLMLLKIDSKMKLNRLTDSMIWKKKINDSIKQTMLRIKLVK